MAWETSDRRERLPADWNQRVAQVKKRDGNQCTWRLPSGARCPRPGRDVDHRANDDNHDLRNLQLLCGTHHDRKTQREAWSGRTRPKTKKRREERQPGRL